MHAELEDFGTGWFGVSLGMREEEIDLLIDLLTYLKKERTQHFHIASDYKGDTGIGDIEFYLQEGSEDNMTIMGEAISPT